MNLEQAVWELENSRAVPISAIEFLIAGVMDWRRTP